MRRALFVLPFLVACNQYDMFRIAGYQQESFTNKADVLFVVDNSVSMVEENEAMADNLDVFIEQLAADAGSATSDGLVDAVDNYIEFAARRTTFIDFHIGVTSTDIGTYYGDLFGDNRVIEFGEPAVVADFQQAVDEAAVLTGSGNEEGLEAVFLAMCRAQPLVLDDDGNRRLPPDACFDGLTPLDEEDIGTNDGLLREGGALIPVIVSDEGDVSRRKDEELGDDVPDEYEDLYRLFGKRMAWAVIGPEPGVCEGDPPVPVPEWTADRYRYLVDDTNGLWFDITQGEPGCEVADFGAALEAIGELINRLLEEFPLQQIPDPDTILVFVDGKRVDPAEVDEDGNYSDGWSYDADENTVRFHGADVPDFDAEVRIYYLPISGMPRDLPF